MLCFLNGHLTDSASPQNRLDRLSYLHVPQEGFGALTDAKRSSVRSVGCPTGASVAYNLSNRFCFSGVVRGFCHKEPHYSIFWASPHGVGSLGERDVFV